MFPDFTFAFQPIVNINTHQIFSYEALIRGLKNNPAEFILKQIPAQEAIGFDQHARNVAIKLAARLNINTHLNLNFTPQSIENTDEYVLETIHELEKYQLPLSKLIIEITEESIIKDITMLKTQIDRFRSMGIQIAFDDFGAGFSNLNWLANFQPDLIKLDMSLIRNINADGPRQAIVKGIIQTCLLLGIIVIAEGVETLSEYHWLKKQNIELMQGYLFGQPGFEVLPMPIYPEKNP
jgi:EAL domain-containing protein (putative c-di-GMP-specific phosphodiesterase class I)